MATIIFNMRLTPDQLERYDRQIRLAEVGLSGQEKLAKARVLIVGIGGLGSPAALYLAAAGVGTLGLVDSDSVALSNLHRQILHATSDLGRPKIVSATEKLRDLNPDTRIRPFPERLTAVRAPTIIEDFDIVLDCTDNFPSKFLVADACHAARKPYIHAGILGFAGQAMTVLPGRTACLRCVFEPPPPPDPTHGPNPVLGVAPGLFGALQAAEAIKLILDIGTLLTNTLLRIDLLTMLIRKTPVLRHTDCPLCGIRPILTPPTDTPLLSHP
jgi:adenylyltransferase/sulfurtransferase